MLLIVTESNVTVMSVMDNPTTEMTIEQLAQRVAMSTRNIREWQRQALLPPPARRGRVGIYSDEHVLRIERVKRLNAEGLPLDVIRRLIEASSGSEAHVRHLAAEVLNPFSGSTSTRVTRTQLTERLGEAALSKLSRLGLIDATEGDTVSVRDAETLNLIEGLVELGVSLDRLVAALSEVQSHQRVIARLVLDAYVKDVWQPFMASGFATPSWAAMAENAARVRPLAIRLLSHLLETALDDVAGSLMVQEANQAEVALMEDGR